MTAGGRVYRGNRSATGVRWRCAGFSDGSGLLRGAKVLFEALDGFGGLAWDDVGIDVEPHLRVRVAEAVADDLDRHAGRWQLRGMGMPEVVEPVFRKLGGPEERPEVTAGALPRLVARSVQTHQPEP